MKRALVVVTALLAGCKLNRSPAPGAGSAAPPVTSPSVPMVDHAASKVDGPAVTPVITSSITFVVPKDATWWAEMAFPCYAAAIYLQPDSLAAAPFTQLSPTLQPAMAAAGIDLEHDIAAVGGWGTAGEPSFYVALAFHQPDKLGAMLKALDPGAPLREISNTHYVITAPGAAGQREIHVQLVPIAWPAKVPADRWSADMARATHVILITGMFGTATSTDPLAMLADPASAPATVKETEGVLGDPRGRCVAGYVGRRDFQPGYQLDRARFGLAAPEGKGDPLTNLLGSQRSLEVAVELTLSPAPTEQTVQGWIDQAKAFVSSSAAAVRAELSGQGPAVEVLFELAGVLGDKGFRHARKDRTLTLTWRTDRIAASDLTAYESRLQAALPGLAH